MDGKTGYNTKGEPSYAELNFTCSGPMNLNGFPYLVILERGCEMKHYVYNTSGTCAKQINFDLDGTTIHNVSFTGGCNGNLKAISKLVEGMDARELQKKLSGNTCGFRSTSCADQLARAVGNALEE